MKTCKDCRHRKITFNGWRCRVGEHIHQEKVTDPLSGRSGVTYRGFTGLPRCEYMRREEHTFILRQCGPEAELWEHRIPWWKMQWVRFDD